MITAPFTYPEAHMALANTSSVWPRHFAPPAATHKSCTPIPTPSDHVHYVQSHAQRNNPTSVLAALDRFAATTNRSSATSLSLNPKAELIIDEVLLPFTPSHCPTASNPLVMLEPLGASLLGYSAIVFASVLAARFGRACVRYIALESDPERAFAAQQIVKHAGLADVVEVALGSVRERAHEIPGRVDLVLLIKPEAKGDEAVRGGLDAMYMEAAWRLMEAGRLVKGSSVVADNMMEPGAPEYGRWAETHPGLESRRYEMVMGEGVDEDGDDEVDAVEVSVVL